MGNGGLLPKGKKDVCKIPLAFTFIPKSSDIQPKNLTCKRTSFPVNLSDGRPITASSWYDRVQPNFSFLHLKLHLLVALSPI